MVLNNSDIKLTANIGVCLKNQNLKTLLELSGDALIRGLSFLHYFLKQSSNFKMISSFKEAELLQQMDSNADFIAEIKDQTKTNTQKVELISDFINRRYFKAQSITDVAMLYKFVELRNILQAQNPRIEIINDALAKPVSDFSKFDDFAKTWIFSLRGLEYTALKIDAFFNEDGEIYYDGNNPLLGERNCPIISSLIN